MSNTEKRTGLWLVFFLSIWHIHGRGSLPYKIDCPNKNDQDVYESSCPPSTGVQSSTEAEYEIGWKIRLPSASNPPVPVPNTIV